MFTFGSCKNIFEYKSSVTRIKITKVNRVYNKPSSSLHISSYAFLFKTGHDYKKIKENILNNELYYGDDITISIMEEIFKIKLIIIEEKITKI